MVGFKKITFHSWKGDDLNLVWRSEGGAMLTLNIGLGPGLERLGKVTYLHASNLSRKTMVIIIEESMKSAHGKGVNVFPIVEV